MKKRTLMQKDSDLEAEQLPPTEKMREPRQYTVAELTQLLAEKKNEIRALRIEIRELKQHANSRVKRLHSATANPHETLHQSLKACSTVEERLGSVRSELAAVNCALVSAETAAENARVERAAAQRALAAVESELKEKENALVKAREAHERALQDGLESAANFSKELQERDNTIRELVQMLRDNGVEVPQRLCTYDHRDK